MRGVIGIIGLVFFVQLEASERCEQHLFELLEHEKSAVAQYGRDRVGVAAVLVFVKNRRILFGLRRGSTEAGRWAFPGGKMDVTDSNLLETAQREAFEETGLLISKKRFRYLKRLDHKPSEKGASFYASYLFVVELMPHEKPKRVECDRCTKWRFFAEDQRPESIFSSNRQLFKKGPQNLYRILEGGVPIDTK